MKIKAFIVITLLLASVLSFSSNSSFDEHKKQLKENRDAKFSELQSCRNECRSQYQSYTKQQCDRDICSSQKTAYQEAQGELDKIAKSQSEVDNKENTLESIKNQWNACTSRCLNRPDNQHSEAHCRNVICQTYKKRHENLQAHSDQMDENSKQLETTEEDSKGNEAVVNQIRETRDKVGASAYVAAGTTAYLLYKGHVCSGQCGGFGGGCCSQAPMYYGMAGLAAIQTAEMFKKRRSLNQTCRDLSANGSCSNIPGFDRRNTEDGGDNEDYPTPPTPLPPGCELNPDLCNNAPGIFSSSPCSPGDPSCSGSSSTANPNPIATITGNDTNTPWLKTVIPEPEGGWPGGKNPFDDGDKFDYNKLSSAQKQQINKAMKAFNQRKKNYMAKHGLLEKGSGGDSSKSGKNLLAENFEDGLPDLSSGFSTVKDSTGSLTGNSVNTGSRRRKAKREPNNAIDKMKEMLKKMSGEDDSSKTGLSNLSVSIGNDNVGVREDNIFLMVHRMNRKLDEKEKRFIIDF